MNYDEIDILINPKTCQDTINLKITKGNFANLNATIFLENCNGKCKFIIIDNKKVVRLIGFYENASDTLVECGKMFVRQLRKGYCRVLTVKCLSPIKVGVWIYYNKKGKEIQRTEYSTVKESLLLTKHCRKFGRTEMQSTSYRYQSLVSA